MNNTNGFGQSERFIEIPWCLNRISGAHTVLDIGYAHAEEAYLRGLANLRIPELHGLDIAPPKHININDPNGTVRPLLTPTQGDIRGTGYPGDMFDLILCISTIEHVGMDNSVYLGPGNDPRDLRGDFQAMVELARITKPGGRFIVTVPFGKPENHGTFRQYDLDRLMRLCTASVLELSEAHYFKYQNGWHECFAYELQNVGYGTNGACNAAGLACVELRKPR